MILTVLRVSLLNLKRDKVALVLSFIVPVAIFSIFAVIFGGMAKGTPRVELAIVDEDLSELSQRLVVALEREPSLTVYRGRRERDDAPLVPYTRADAEGLIKTGKLPAAVILPKGLGAGFPRFDGQQGGGPTIEVLNDSSNQIAGQMLAGLLQKVVMTGVPDAFMKGGIEQFEKHAGQLSETQRKAIDEWMPMLKKAASGDTASAMPQAAGDTTFGLIPIKTIDLVGQNKPVIAFYAAGTAVMFLLFTCAHGGGGTMLEELESGTLDRLLSSNLTMPQLLVGKWLWLTAVGFVQVSVMFVFGWLVFQVELPAHLIGFAVMTAATAAAASSFGLILGTLCKTRGQLAGMATTVIFIMSAVGGSMFPRFLMPPFMKTLGLFTFNGWALDGYQKVFWFEVAVWELWPQVLVLLGLAFAFLLAARLLARRWESV